LRRASSANLTGATSKSNSLGVMQTIKVAHFRLTFSRQMAAAFAL
jgi:hypothetical protein